MLVDGDPGEPASFSQLGAGVAEFVTIVRGLGDPTPDPTVWLRRRRTAGVSGIARDPDLDQLVLASGGHHPHRPCVRRSCRDRAGQVGSTDDRGGRRLDRDGLRYSRDRLDVDVAFAGAQVYRQDGETFAEWSVALVGALERARSDGRWPSATSVPSWCRRARRAGIAVPVIAADDRRLGPVRRRIGRGSVGTADVSRRAPR